MVPERGTVTVVVVTHDSARWLPRHLEALPAALAPVDRWELVVVDSGSADDSVEVARRCAPGATVVALGTNRGYAAGINTGIATGRQRGPVLVLNPDTLPEPGSLGRLVSAAGAPGVGIAVPRLVDEAGTTQHTLRRRPTVARALGEAVLGGRAGRIAWLGETIHDPRCYEVASTVDWAGGAAWCLSRQCLDAVGPWDESYFLYSEEADYAFRAADAGYGVGYVPDAVVAHARGDVHRSPALFALLTVNRVRLHRRRAGRLSGAAFWAAVMLNSTLRALAGAPPHRAALRALWRDPDKVVADTRRLLAATPAGP